MFLIHYGGYVSFGRLLIRRLRIKTDSGILGIARSTFRRPRYIMPPSAGEVEIYMDWFVVDVIMCGGPRLNGEVEEGSVAFLTKDHNIYGNCAD